MKKYCFYKNENIRNQKYQLLFSYKTINENINRKEYQGIECIKELSENIIIYNNRKNCLIINRLDAYCNSITCSSIAFYKISKREYAYEFEAENDRDVINQVKLLIEIGEIK